MIKHKAHRIRKRNRCRAQFPDLCHLAMLGLTISICRSCWVVLGSVSTPCLAHSRNTFIANVLKNYHPHPFSRDQRGEGGFLWYPGEVVKWKKQPSQWLLPSFGSGDTWGRHDGKIHRWTLESNTKSSAPAPMFFCLFFYDWSHFFTVLATHHLVGLRGHRRVWDQMPTHILEDPVLPYFSGGRGISGAAQEIKHQVFNRKAIIYSVV